MDNNQTNQTQQGNSEQNYVFSGKTKACKQCGTIIDARLKVCPKCFKKQPKKTPLIILGIIVLLVVIIGLTTGNDGKEPTNTDNVNKEEANTDAKQDEADAKDDISSEESIYKIGQVAELNDVKITMENVKESKGNDWGEPAKGKKFVYVKVKIENNSEDDIIVSSMASFDAYCDDYKLEYSSNALMAISTEKNMQGLDGTVSTGKKLSGYLGFEVPKKWKSIELHYTDNIWIGEKIKFLIEN